MRKVKRWVGRSKLTKLCLIGLNVIILSGCVAGSGEPSSNSSYSSSSYSSSSYPSNEIGSESSLSSANFSQLASSSQTATSAAASNLSISSLSSSVAMIPEDQCNATAQCREHFGNVATDCRDSMSDNSVCWCGAERCDTFSALSTSSSLLSSSSALSISSTNNVSSSSQPASIDAAQTYIDLCSGCHGPNGDDGLPLNNDKLDLATMITQINDTMPIEQNGASPSDCEGECAKAVAEYIKLVLLAEDRVELRTPLTARLTKPQIVNSLQDIFNVVLDSDVVALVPRETIDEKGFITLAENQRMEAQHPRSYAQLAVNAFDKLNINSFSQNLVGCSTLSNTCLNDLVDELGLRLFRRPLDEIERQHYQDLAAELQRFDGINFGDVSGGVVKAMIQAPQFIYRTEQERGQEDTARDLSGFELASRLAFFLWQSAPDKELLDFASVVERDGFNNSALDIQVSRMMQDERYARARTTFWQDYTITSTAALLEAGEDLAADLKTSLMATLERASGLGANPIPLQKLFSTQQMMLTEALAERLGLLSQGVGLKPYNTSSTPERMGFLSHPGFMANIGSTSFVGRGVVLTERILCREIFDPPAGIQDDIDDTAMATESLTPRGAKDYRFNLGGACAACHRSFEPIAFAFEQFDVLGMHTEQDSEGRDLFTYGYLQSIDGTEGPQYDDVAGLMMLLEESDETSRCFVQNMQVFASGRKHMKVDDVGIEAAHARYIDAGGTFDALVKSVALSPEFRLIDTVDN